MTERVNLTERPRPLRVRRSATGNWPTSRLWPLLGLCLGALLFSGCTTYEVYRGARVPRPVPPPTGAQAMTGAVEAGLSAGGFAEVAAPRQGKTDAGLFLPRLQGRADVRFRLFEGMSLGLAHERGFAAGSRALVKGTPEPEGDAAGYGFSMRYSARAGSGPWRLGVSGDFMVYQIPYIEYRIALDENGEARFIEEEQGMSAHPVVSVSLLSSYVLSDRLSFTGSATIRNHPTVERTGQEVGQQAGWDNVESGPLNVTLAAGIEYTHQTGVRASLLAYQTLVNDPVQYYPALSAAITVPLMRY